MMSASGAKWIEDPRVANDVCDHINQTVRTTNKQRAGGATKLDPSFPMTQTDNSFNESKGFKESIIGPAISKS